MLRLTELLRKDLRRIYLSAVRRIWWRLPARLRHLPPAYWYGLHLHTLVRRLAERRQNHSTFFFRNRPELELLLRLVNRASHGAHLTISVLACSKGAEVYSIAWTLRSARPDLNLSLHAVDISPDILEFAKAGVYSLRSSAHGMTEGDTLTENTQKHQVGYSIFERMTEHEMKSMFEVDGDVVRVKPWLKEGISWHCHDVEDPELVTALGPQDVVVANRFLCHMGPAPAERCLTRIAQLVKPGGHLFVSGIDLDVRAKMARRMGWKPVTDLLQQVHEGDASLTNSWPLAYWAVEPFRTTRRDRMIRYAAAFRLALDACFVFCTS
jgi:chemotaxis protein methyltransferase CheR